jgi:acyl CoA:acetate/3-ketoacid CoA transferase
LAENQSTIRQKIMSQFIDIIINAIVGLGTGLIGFVAGRKRQNLENDGLAILNVEKALDIYKEMLDDMKLRYDREIELMKQKLSEYEKHILILESKIKELKKPKTNV